MKKIDPKKQKGLAALKKKAPQVVAKMGYMKKGGRVKKGFAKKKKQANKMRKK